MALHEAPVQNIFISTDNLALGYNGRPVISGLNLRWVQEDGPLAITGSNGSGKTTFLRTCLGLIPPVSGSLSLFGMDPGRSRFKTVLRSVGWVPQQRTPGALRIKVRDLVAMGRGISMRPFKKTTDRDRAAIIQAMETCGITDLSEKLVQELSGGQFQRVNIARALAGEPALLFLDEPTTFLDQHSRAGIKTLMETLIEKKETAVILVSHDPELTSLCSKIWYFDNGGVQKTDTAYGRYTI